MKCCHIDEVKAYIALTTPAARDEKLTALELVDINNLRNLITMCEKCHVHFDKHRIGIHPVDWRWIMTDDMRGKVSPSSTPYIDIHGQPILQFSQQPWYSPSVAVLKDRMAHFVSKNCCKGSKSKHYCHFCTETFTGVAGYEEMENHIQSCPLAPATQQLNIS